MTQKWECGEQTAASDPAYKSGMVLSLALKFMLRKAKGNTFLGALVSSLKRVPLRDWSDSCDRGAWAHVLVQASALSASWGWGGHLNP